MRRITANLANLANQDLRKAAREAGVTLWMIADHLGKSEATITRMLRKELTRIRKAELMDLIEEISVENARKEAAAK